MFKKYIANNYPHELLATLKEFDANQKAYNSRVFMNARNYADLRKFHRDALDMSTSLDEMQTGKMADLGKTALIVSKLVTEGVCYMATETESTTLQAFCMAAKDPSMAEEIAANFKRLVDVWDKAEAPCTDTVAPKREFLFPVTKALRNPIDNYYGETPIPVKFETDKGLCQLATVSGNLEIVGDIGFIRMAFDPNDEATQIFIKCLESRPDDVYLQGISWREVSRNEVDGRLEAGATSELVNLVFDDEKPGSHGPIYEVTGGEPVRLVPA